MFSKISASAFHEEKHHRNIEIIHKSPSPIFFIGMMGSGKSTLGKLFAESLQYNFIEMDETIEQENGISINEIFKQKGEPFFRNEERKMLQHISKVQKTVISCGGGTFTNQKNITIINQKGISVFLNVSSSVLESRLKNDTKRPLLQQNKTAMQILLKRIPFYTQAHIMVDITLNNLEENIFKITNEVARHLA